MGWGTGAVVIVCCLTLGCTTTAGTDEADSTTTAPATGTTPPESVTTLDVAPTVAATTPPATTAPATTVAATTVPVTSAASTTVPTTSAPTTTEPAEDGAVILRDTGIGPLEFGVATEEDAEALLTPLLGASSVTNFDYPVALGTYFENPTEEKGFAFQYGSDYCFENQLCLFFGGDDFTREVLVGYRQGEHPDALTTRSGVTAGSVGADYADVIRPLPGGCFSTGGGIADGVSLTLRSTGVPFLEFVEADNTYVESTPPVADVLVLSLGSGVEPFFLFDDC